MPEKLLRASVDEELPAAAQSAVEQLHEALSKEPDYVTIPVKLSGRDMKNIERIVGAKFEVLEDATLAVRVRLK